jgi:hypothetical protein
LAHGFGIHGGLVHHHYDLFGERVHRSKHVESFPSRSGTHGFGWDCAESRSGVQCRLGLRPPSVADAHESRMP